MKKLPYTGAWYDIKGLDLVRKTKQDKIEARDASLEAFVPPPYGHEGLFPGVLMVALGCAFVAIATFLGKSYGTSTISVAGFAASCAAARFIFVREERFRNSAKRLKAADLDAALAGDVFFRRAEIIDKAATAWCRRVSRYQAYFNGQGVMEIDREKADEEHDAIERIRLAIEKSCENFDRATQQKTYCDAHPELKSGPEEAAIEALLKILNEPLPSRPELASGAIGELSEISRELEDSTDDALSERISDAARRAGLIKPASAA